MKFFSAFIFSVVITISLQAKILSSDTIIINHTKFLFVKSVQVNEDYSTKHDTILRVYRIENGTRKYLLAQTIYTWSADCNSEFEDHGSFSIRGDSVIFTTVFDVERDKNFGLPYQQQQIYVVKEDGRMILVSDKSEMEDGTWRDNLNPQ